MDTFFYSFFLCVTNVPVIFALNNVANKRPHEFILFYATAFASFSYHLVEQKHGLKGIIHTTHWGNFLWVDRLFALSTFIYLVCSYYYMIPRHYILISFALFMCGFSEYIGLLGHQQFFVVTHCLWHCSVYYILYLVSLEK